mmetsp:Transcript_8750/g.17079  ORF Transcript_8750/g.17079 Transcript_8750/m.17079 type:complete len:286 (+) Transcript_8750:117-974(+)
MREEGYMYSIDNKDSMTLLEFELHTEHVQKLHLDISLPPDAGFVGLKGRRVMIAGGVLPDFSTTKTAYIISASPIAVREIASLPNESRKLRLVYDNDRRVFALGGVREKKEAISGSAFNFEYSKNFSVYSLDTNTWQSLPDLKQGTENPTAWISSDRIYVAGGAYSSGTLSTNLDTVQFCSLVSFSWQIANYSLPHPLHSLQAAVCSRGTFFFGGIDENDKDSRGTFLYTPQGYQELARLPLGCSCAFPTYTLMHSGEVLTINYDNTLCGLDLTSWAWSVQQGPN